MEHPLIIELRAAIEDGAGVDVVIQQINEWMLHPPLIGAGQVAEVLGISSHTNIYKLRGLPEPAISPPRGQLWDRQLIEAFRTRKNAAKNG